MTTLTARATIHEGKIELLEPVDWPDEAQVLVTLLPEEEQVFWQSASQPSLDAVWDNEEDDVYAELLKG